MKDNIIAHIKEKMTQGGFNAYSLEKQAGLKPSAVQNILMGRSKNPSIHTIRAIATALNCSVSDLLGEDLKGFIGAQDTSQYPHVAIIKDAQLYIKCLAYFSALLLKKNIWIEKQKVLDYTDELYLYSCKKELTNKVDAHFAQWLIDKNLK